MEIISNIEQGTQEWLDLRLGLITCSEIKTIRADGKGAQTYINGLAYERITGEPASVFAGNEWTERGHELEDVARDLYMQKTGLAVEQVSFIKNKGFGYSPDGLIELAMHESEQSDAKYYKYGAVEIKAKQPKDQIAILRSGEIPKDHIDQLHGGISCGELAWIDFVSYCPNLPIFIKRVFIDDVREHTENIELLVEKYNKQIDEIVELLTGMY